MNIIFDKALTEDEVKQLPSLLDTLTEIEIGSSSTNPKKVSLPEDVTYVDNMPYNEQNPVWKDIKAAHRMTVDPIKQKAKNIAGGFKHTIDYLRNPKDKKFLGHTDNTKK